MAINRTLVLTVRFETPAFLGDADQKGAWRTPPFKNLLRHWWRVAVAPDHGHVWNDIREREGRLFGHAFLQHRDNTWAARSRVRLRLDRWEPGRLDSRGWPRGAAVNHPGVPRAVDCLLYLGYGPVTWQGGRATLSRPSALAPGEEAVLTVGVPPEEEERLREAVQLAAWFGTLGGRSRNGWGSLSLEAPGLRELTPKDPLLERCSRPLADCLREEWPHALGVDDRGLLVWRTRQGYSRWEEAMRELAEVKIAFRTDLPWQGCPVEERHLLGYPVTRHAVPAWGSEGRLANQLRFKVVREENGYRGLAFHLPCRLPRALRNKAAPGFSEALVWAKVHQCLDGRMKRL